MADDADRAQAINDQFQQDMIRRAVSASRAPADQGTDYCIDCEEDIPLSRQIAMPGAKRCVDCQQMHENWRPL
jgi:phage/conjugal plasmid C-4 type zinc finger TraR family protein